MNTVAAVRDPVTAMTAQFGERVIDARREVDRLVGILAHIDELTANLEGEGVHVTAELGPVGDAAAQARRQVEAGAVTPKRFALPKARDAA